ncbi:AraC family transcriptional regulator [Ciceribacter lividus]|uniref:AraC family transcriptional regulator n=1 Tax=Ciceribacter lividus TaxID=1197950 RepID=A0A6I7HIU5_9HYPH|nr:AraC family transcriptional regulator [Ciceribacter lividus]RCW20208.1 AraC family transcriptional regulator [Ciceribacter lividus]
MLLVPLSFLVSLLLFVFLVRLLRQGREALGRNRLFVVLIGLYVVQTALVGIRWGYGVTAVLPALPLLASLIPPLSFVAFRELAAEEGAISARDWPHLLPTLCCVVAMLVGFRDPVDLVLIAEFAGYGLALLWLARLGPDGLVASRLDGTLRSYRSLQLTALALIGSAATDMAISLDLLLAGGRHAPAVVSAATTFILLMLGVAAMTAGAEEADDAPEAEPELQAVPLATSADAEVAAALDRLMEGQRLFADAGLNLGRLARRLGLPARAVSNAVNRVHGMSVSQYVNNFRVAEACRLLGATDMPVTRIVFEAGFMTKSNFNREFLRVTGMNPTAWRAAAPREVCSISPLEGEMSRSDRGG